MKKKLLSPTELKEFRKHRNGKNDLKFERKGLVSPKTLLDGADNNSAVESKLKDAAVSADSDIQYNAFELFKNSLKKIESISNLSTIVDEYKDNIDKVNVLSDEINFIKGEVEGLIKKEDLDNAMLSQLFVFENCIEDIQSKIKSVNGNKLLEISSTVESLEKLLNEIEGKNKKEIETVHVEVSNYRDEVKNRISDISVDLIRNNSRIKVQNENLKSLQEEVKSTLDKLNIDKIERVNYKLFKRVKYLEEVFEKFNEERVLEREIIVESSSTKTKDPLTPLDQNFVTFEQLQQHYRVFINRIQQQLTSLGGGGETRLEFLDDIDRDSAKVNGRFLKYDVSLGKWVGAVSAGEQTLDETLELGNTSSRGMIVGMSTATKLHVDSVGTGVTFA